MVCDRRKILEGKVRALQLALSGGSGPASILCAISACSASLRWCFFRAISPPRRRATQRRSQT